MKRKFTAILLLMCICMAVFTGCAEEKTFVGIEKIESFRAEAAGYDSARYYIENVDTNVMEQVFSFYYDSGGSQIYLCEGVEGENYYAEFSNGVELFREENNESAIIPSTDESYAAYTKKEPHPYSNAQLLFYVKNYIDYAEEGLDDEGNTLYVYTYDIVGINEALGNNLTTFATSYAFDKEGNFVYFRQHNSSDATDENGNVINQGYTYEITIDDINSVTEIENPVKID